MVGDGVIAESYVSFNITWKNPGNGGQSEWDQTKQDILLHTVDLYPDLLYTKASALATYYKLTSAARILEVVKEINSVIDKRLSQKNEALDLTDTSSEDEPSVTQDKTEKPDNKEIIDPEKKPLSEPENKPVNSPAYTVKVIGDRLRLMDAQSRGSGYSSVSIRHRVSNNIAKAVGDERLQNSGQIRAEVEVGGVFGSTVKMEYSDFNMPDGRNLLVEIFPSIELRFTPDQKAVAPKSETLADEESWVSKFAKKLMPDSRLRREIVDANEIAKSKRGPNK